MDGGEAEQKVLSSKKNIILLFQIKYFPLDINEIILWNYSALFRKKKEMKFIVLINLEVIQGGRFLIYQRFKFSLHWVLSLLSLIRIQKHLKNISSRFMSLLK